MAIPSPFTVAYDASPLYGPMTGVGVATRELLAGLDLDQRVVAQPYVLSGRATPKPGHRRLPVPGIVASHIWSRGRWPSADRWLRPADIVHGTNYTAPPSRLPTLISVYDCWFLTHPELANPLVRRAGLQLRRAVDAGAHLHVSSAATADVARDILATERVSVILLGPPGLATGEDPPAPEVTSALGDRPFIVAIGTEERRKGYPRLIESFGLAIGRGLDADLVIAGSPGDDSDTMDQTLLTLAANRRDRIHRLGRIGDGTKRWLIERARILAYPSLDEGFGFPILEAQRASVPIVATQVGSIPEVAGTGALLVDGTIESIADGLIELWDDDELQTDLIRAGRANLARFSWQRTTDAMIDLYERVIGEAS